MINAITGFIIGFTIAFLMSFVGFKHNIDQCESKYNAEHCIMYFLPVEIIK